MKEQENNNQNEEIKNQDNPDNQEQTAEATEQTTEQAEPTPEEAQKIAEETIESLKNQLLYKQAEFDNYRKRTLKEKAELILCGGEKTITAMLPVLDDFERAIADKSDDPKAIHEGMTLIYNKFLKILEQQGVKKIETADADFNTDYHEAVAMVPGLGDAMHDKVIDCVQTGYTLNDKVIRHAKVAVGA